MISPDSTSQCSGGVQLKDLQGITWTHSSDGTAVAQPICDKCMHQFFCIIFEQAAPDFSDVTQVKESCSRGLFDMRIIRQVLIKNDSKSHHSRTAW